MGEIFEFLTKMSETHDWDFRYTEENHFYWVKSNGGEITTTFPFLNELKKKIYSVKVLNDKITPYLIVDDTSNLFKFSADKT